MKLTCDACKLTLNARDEDRGKAFTCPICRAPLREMDGAARPVQEQKSAGPTLEWSGGTLDDLLYMVNAQALAAIIEVFQGGDKKGEVHVIAGGIDEAFADAERGDDALATLRQAHGARFRVELRLPDEETGTLATPGPDKGELKVRPLARLMRYCELYVLTCDLEVWRGNESCRVEYRRGNIARTLVGGIDAPEQLGEVMGWTTGNFRFVLPRLALPQAADEATRAQARAAAQTLISDQKAARKTIFGMAPPAVAPAAPAQPVPMTAKPEPAPAESAAARGPMATMIGMPAVTPSLPERRPDPVAASSTPSVMVDESYAAALSPVRPEAAAAPARVAETAEKADRTEPLRRDQKPAAKATVQMDRSTAAAAVASTPPEQEDSGSREAPQPGAARWVKLGFVAIGAAAVGWMLVRMLVQ